jgi:hypothetical protein
VGGVLGGLYANGAVDDRAGLVFENGLNWPDTSAPGTGDLYALAPDGKTLLWDYQTSAPNGSGVAIANGVVYFQSLDGNLYALDEHATSASTALLARVQTGDTYSGPAISNGRVFEGTGNSLLYFFGVPVTGGITALGLPPKAVQDLPGDLADLAGALMTANVGAAAGQTNPGQINQAVNGVVKSADKVIGDLAAIINVQEPSLNALHQDVRSYFFAVAANDTAGAQAAEAAVKADLSAIGTALATPAANPQALAGDLAAVFGSLDKILADQLARNSAATAQDTAAELAALTALSNDLLAGRYGIHL